MVSLEVGIDARGVVQGGAQAATALSGISQLAMVAATSLSGVTTAATGFGAALRTAMPWITAVGAALSGISTGLLLMSNRTREAADTWDKFTAAVNKAQAAARLPSSFGAMDNSAIEMGALRDRALAIQTGILSGSASPESARDFGARLNLEPRDVIRAIQALPSTSQMERLQLQRYLLPDAAIAMRDRPDHFQVSPEQQIGLLGSKYGYLRQRESMRGAPAYPGPLREGYEQFSLRDELPGYRNAFGYGPGESGVSMDPARQSGIDQAIRERNEKALNDERQAAADRLLDTAMRISDTFADGVTNLAFGLTTAREAAAGLLYDLARGLSREAVGSLTKSIVNQFSYTPKQTG